MSQFLKNVTRMSQNLNRESDTFSTQAALGGRLWETLYIVTGTGLSTMSPNQHRVLPGVHLTPPTARVTRCTPPTTRGMPATHRLLPGVCPLYTRPQPVVCP